MSNGQNNKPWMIIVCCIALLFAGVWLFCCLHHTTGGHAGCGCCGGGYGGGVGGGANGPIKSGNAPTTIMSGPSITNPTQSPISIFITIHADYSTNGPSNVVKIFANSTLASPVSIVINKGGHMSGQITINLPPLGMIQSSIPAGVVMPGEQDVILTALITSPGITWNSSTSYPTTINPPPPPNGSPYYSGVFTSSTSTNNDLSIVMVDQAVVLN